jgi:DNA-binding NarL/FixJ family response regulator
MDSAKPLRILVAENHDVVRRSVRTALESEPAWTVCGEATTGLDALAKTTTTSPDVVVLDVGLPGVTGVAVTREICRVAPAVSVVVLTMHTSMELAQQLHDAGARGYVRKADVGRSLVDAIKTVIDKTASSDDQAPAIVDDRTEHQPVGGEVGAANVLTAREREVMRLLAEGKSNKEIGGVLTISPKTVGTHRARLMSKLQLHSMNQLVRFAIRHRIIVA